MSDIIDQLVHKLAEGLEKWTPQLLPRNEKLQSDIEVLKRQLAGKKLLTVVTVVPEVHINQRLVDPAAETELEKLFKKAGFEVIEAKGKVISQWARDLQKDPEKPLPSGLTDVNVIITGEGLSEFGARFGNLISCVGRLEVQATERGSRRVIAAERTTRRAVDLSEAIASKTALQAAGHELAIKLMKEIAQQIEKRRNEGSGTYKTKQ